MKLLITAGYTKDDEKVKSNKKKLKKTLKKKYLEGVNKALIGIEQDYPLLQKMIDTYRDSGFISEIFVVGPKKEYEDLITGCELIDYNKSPGLNIKRGLEELSGEKVAISTVDLPYVELDHIKEYFNAVQPFMDKDFIYQLVENSNLKKQSWWKPSYMFLDGNRQKRTVPGHLNIIDTKAIPEFVYRALDFIYDELRGEPFVIKTYKVMKELHKEQLLGPFWSCFNGYLSKFFRHSLKKEEYEKVIERIAFSTHIEITNIHEFAEDIDTESELEQAIMYISSNSNANSQQRRQFFHKDKSDSSQQVPYSPHLSP